MTGYLALAWVMRSEHTSLARLCLRSSRLLPAWTAVTAAALALIMTVPALRSAFAADQHERHRMACRDHRSDSGRGLDTDRQATAEAEARMSQTAAETAG